MSSQIVAQKIEPFKVEDLEVLKFPVVKNPLLKRHFSVPSIPSSRILHPYTISSEETGESMAQNLFDLIVRSFWNQRVRSVFFAGRRSTPSTTAPSVERSDDRISEPTRSGSEF